MAATKQRNRTRTEAQKQWDARGRNAATAQSNSKKVPVASNLAPLPEGLATVKQACDFLQITTPTIYNLIANKRLTSTKIGRARRITWESLHRVTGEKHAQKKPDPVASDFPLDALEQFARDILSSIERLRASASGAG